MKSRTYRSSRRAGSGAALGYLGAWCQAQDEFRTKAEHMAFVPCFAARRAARDVLNLEPNVGFFKGLEQYIAAAGEGSEPEEIYAG